MTEPKDPLWPDGLQKFVEGGKGLDWPVWKFDADGMKRLNDIIRMAGRRRFVGMKFWPCDKVLEERYSWDDWWFVEVRVATTTTRGYIAYRLQTNTAAIVDGPDYRWLRTHFESNYGAPQRPSAAVTSPSAR